MKEKLTSVTIVTITPADVKREKFTFSETGQVIDELAYCAKQWTSNELWEYNIDYQPNEPYHYHFEVDLLNATQTATDLLETASKLNVYLVPNKEMIEAKGLQAGAGCALYLPEKWNDLLEAYTKSLKENYTDSMSTAYNEALEKEISEYEDDQYREWLNGNRDYAGVINEIARYFTESREGSYDCKADSYTFLLNEEDITTATDEGYTTKQLKKWLLDSAKESGNARQSKERAENDERRERNARIKAHKEEQAKRDEEARKEKLLAMRLND